ncbi:glycosyltransferase family protein [Portibacter lacus]|uniref:Glycosyl transferase n=1 Tax=Portibacter lacus TaxID=1099794 RepID=A0AA37WHN5_9BACT|nr:glycosyltransferase [Portibacter lacus]GLR18885.1 glycosyl transferase [Portibacter lacus]
MRALVIYRVDISNLANQGVSKKMQGHVYGLTQNGYEVDVIYISENGLYLNQNCLCIFNKNSVSRGIFKARTFYKVIKARIDAGMYDLVLFRFHLVMEGMIRLFAMLKSHSPSIKIIIDMPTYPYEQEWKGARGKLLLKIDEKNRQRLSKYVDLMIHYGKEEEIWGIPCINSTNGIITAKAPLRIKERSDKLELLAVGKWAYWHGLDRIIYGVSESEIDLHLTIVGVGPESDHLTKLVKELSLENRVSFEDNLIGESLNRAFDKADIGIGTLGIQRKGVMLDSSLKHRDYCSRGLPFILGSEDIDFPELLGFVKYFPGDGPIDIGQVLQFYESTKGVEERMMVYAERHLDWAVKMKEVVDAL